MKENPARYGLRVVYMFKLYQLINVERTKELIGMKRTLLTFFICLLFSQSNFAQNKNMSTSDKIAIEKWSKAIVNLEGRPHHDNSDEIDQMIQKFQNKEITAEELGNFMFQKSLSVGRYTGTAVFFKNNDKHYLITARHVIENTDKGKNTNIHFGKVFDKIFLIANGSKLLNGNILKNDTGGNDRIMLMNFNAGTSDGVPFNFSSKEDDLAILCLDNKNSMNAPEFVATLYARGYNPVTIDDINLGCKISNGDEIMALGFTGDVSEIGRKTLSVAEFGSESDLITLPVVSKGTIGNARPSDNKFSGNIFVYKGNSGGPIVSDGKLIGIVSSTDASIDRIQTQSLDYYLSRNINFIKSSLIMPLLNDLDERLEDTYQYMRKHRSKYE